MDRRLLRASAERSVGSSGFPTPVLYRISAVRSAATAYARHARHVRTPALPRRVCVCVWIRHRLAEIEGQLGELDGGRDIEGRVAPELLAKRSTSTRRCARRFVVDSSAGSMARGSVKLLNSFFLDYALCAVRNAVPAPRKAGLGRRESVVLRLGGRGAERERRNDGTRRVCSKKN